MFPWTTARRTLLLATLGLAPLVLGAAGPQRVDRVISVVGPYVICESDLGLEQAIAEHDRSPLPPFNSPDVDLLTSLEDYRILRHLAGDTRIHRPPTAEVDARVAAFQASFLLNQEFSDFLTRWDLDEEELRELLYLRLVAERYVQRHLGPPPPAAELAATHRYRLRYESWMQELRPQLTTRHPDSR